MLDFLSFGVERRKTGGADIVPEFELILDDGSESKDLMIRGGDFYAVYNDISGLWETREAGLIKLVDRELDKFKAENLERLMNVFGDNIGIKYMRHGKTRMIDEWHHFCKDQCSDHFKVLDQRVIFANTEVKREDYASKRLPYALEEGSIDSYERIISTLYSPEERRKLEWAIGSIVAGKNSLHHKFIVLYGDPGTGKSTIINIIKDLFDGYTATFDAKALGTSSNNFAMETFRGDPVVAIQHDGDLSRIEDNTRLNSLVAHEEMVVNVKNKSQYSANFNTFLFMATNKPVKITDAKSGIIRRLIEVTPTGDKIPKKEFDILKRNLKYELGGIAYHCLQVYEEDPDYYDNYIPTGMMAATNDFYNFMEERYYDFCESNQTSADAAFDMYTIYCERSKVQYPMPKRIFKEELKSYFKEYYERIMIEGVRYRGFYRGFRKDRFISMEEETNKEKNSNESTSWLKFNCTNSLLDIFLSDQKAQYEVDYGRGGQPERSWNDCTTTLNDITTSKVHYVRVPGNLIVVDFDIPDENGNKCFELNYKAASKWPPTYAELSKSGEGIHLHYFYTGDISKLAPVAGDHVEIKVFPTNKKSALRRKVSQCNDIQIAKISSGLPLKGDDTLSCKQDVILNERMLRKIINKALDKEYRSKSTADNIFVIQEALKDAYNSGIFYDVSDLEEAVKDFANKSSNQAQDCFNRYLTMHFRSKDAEEKIEEAKAPACDSEQLGFFDIEVWKNRMLICWCPDVPKDFEFDWNTTDRKKWRQFFDWNAKRVIRWWEPTPDQLLSFFNGYLAVGYNNLRYDNAICHIRIGGASNLEMYNLSQGIIKGNVQIPYDSKHWSFTDIYDFLSAANKKSLKKHECESGMPHEELDNDWDEPLPENMKEEAEGYCVNDVTASLAVFHKYHSDFEARVILAKLAGGTPNDTTNQLSTKFIFGDNKNPQGQFQYRNMGDISTIDEKVTAEKIKGLDISFPEFTKFDSLGKPVFPGYSYSYGKSCYREFNQDNPNKDEQVVGEGGLAWSIPGYYEWAALDDVESMHPSSIIAENAFGSLYTKRFEDLKTARLLIKHEKWDEARVLLDGILSPFVDLVLKGEIAVDDLSTALKTVINSVYGLTAAAFKNPFRDPRNVDNFIAKRGALFMINLKHEIEAKGYTVAHIKTDSVKIPNADPYILKFVSDYGKLYGYNFEHEATYDRLVITNKAVYVARHAGAEDCEKLYGYCPKDNKKHPGEWTATGKEFQVPYIFKKLFSKEDITLDDLSNMFSVSTSLYLDMNENMTKDDHNYRFVGKVGNFTPIKPGLGGGYLMRRALAKDGSVTYGYANGAKGYRWAETDRLLSVVNSSGENGVFDIVDTSYFDTLLEDAVKDLTEYVDVEKLIA